MNNLLVQLGSMDVGSAPYCFWLFCAAFILFYPLEKRGHWIVKAAGCAIAIMLLGWLLPPSRWVNNRGVVLIWYVLAWLLISLQCRFICRISWAEAFYCGINAVLMEHIGSSAQILLALRLSHGRIALNSLSMLAYVAVYFIVWLTFGRTLLRGQDHLKVDRLSVALITITGLTVTIVLSMVDMIRLGGWQTMAIDSISKPMSSDQDGPAGISSELIMSNVDCMGYPNQMVLASTWSTELSEEFGKCIGEDGLAVDVQGWYAPGAGMHRSNYGGRNYEYYAEDSYLSGAMCAAEVGGAQSKGMYCYLKHMVLNDQEDHRYGINTFVTEQALREFYLEPFEMAVKQADCHGIMAAFNGIGGIWCGANSALMTDVLKNEWGFHGIVVTDYATANGGYMWMDMGTQAGTDLWLNSDAEAYSGDTSNISATYAQVLRRTSHDILYTVVNSSAMNGIDENVKVVKVTPQWKVWLYCLDAFVGLVILGGIFLIVRRCKKNKA